MITEFGHFALILAFFVALFQAVVPLVGAQRGWPGWMATAAPAAALQFLLTAAAFLALMWAFVSSDFSLRLVVLNSHTAKPLLYKITGVWGNHEGSMLLWVLIVTLFGFFAAWFGGALPPTLRARVLSIQAMIGAAFFGFILFTSNPFLRVPVPPFDGQDLNPLLQDPGLAFHPPFLYLGYVGLSMSYSFAVAALIEGRVDAAWGRWVRPYTLASWMFLTVGIGLGSWWAYYELGWGGFWFWDPVENASFMPWLVGTALIHSQAVTEKRGGFRGWTMLLAIAAFSLSLLGTFIVRSGVLTSVHAFASDPSRGLFILVFLGLVVGGSLVLYALRAPESTGKPFAWLSRETLLLVNNLLFSAAAAMVLIGTLSPLLFEALDLGKISVGPPYFASQFFWLMLPVVLVLPFGPFTRWGSEVFPRLWPTLRASLAAAVIAIVLVLLLGDGHPFKAVAGVAGAAWILGGTGLYAFQRIRQLPAGRRIAAETLGMLLAHTGVALFVAGVLVVETMGVEKDVAVVPGQETDVLGYRFRFDGVTEHDGPNFRASRGSITVFDGERQIVVLHPEKRAYSSGGQVMTEAAIAPGLMRDLYVALGESLGGESWALRIYVKPLIRWIWLGALFMVAGGFIVGFDRRFRREFALQRQLANDGGEK